MASLLLIPMDSLMIGMFPLLIVGFFLQEAIGALQAIWRSSHGIPKAYIPIMQEGIDVEILGSYAWLQDVDQDLNDRLLRHVASFHP